MLRVKYAIIKHDCRGGVQKALVVVLLFLYCLE